jgi:hypothetical protein
VKAVGKIAAVGSAIFMAGFTSRADTLTFNYNAAYTDSYTPGGDAPWMRATFTQIDASTVRLEVDSLSLQKGEFVTTWGFNLDPNIDPATLKFSLVSAVNYNGNTTVETSGQDSVKAGGDQRLDFDLAFSTGQNIWQEGSTNIYTITRSSSLPLSANDFNWQTVNKNLQIDSSAHVQGLANGNSAWLYPSAIYSSSTQAVPEASTAVVLVFLAGVVCVSRFQRRTSK